MDAHLIHTTPSHHPPKMDVLPKTFLQIMSLLLNGYSTAFKYVPQTTATTFAFSSVCFSFYDFLILVLRGSAAGRGDRRGGQPGQQQQAAGHGEQGGVEDQC